MGVGAGIFDMTNVLPKTADSAEPNGQESDLVEAYAQSASHDKQIATEFDGTLADGLISVNKALNETEAVL